MTLYANHVGVPISSLRFQFDGRRINEDDTPEALELEENDMIEVDQEQNGGGDDSGFLDDPEITVEVVGPHADEIRFTLFMSTPMGNLRRAYAHEAAVPISSLKLYFFGTFVDDDETPDELGMINNDMIEAL